MKNKLKFPLQIKNRALKVTIYPPTPALPYYRICYRAGGKRVQRTRRTLEAAQREAQVILGKLKAGEVSVAEITPLEAAMLQTARSLLDGLNIRLDQAAGEYAEAMRLLDGIPLKKAVSFYIDHNPTKNCRITTGEIVKEFIAAKMDGGASRYYLSDLRRRTMSLVCKLDCELSQLTPGKLGDYFRKLNTTGQNHNNHLRVLGTLFRFAKQQGYLNEATDLLKAVSKKKVRKGSYCIYQPEEFAALLEGANADMLPPLVLLGFCGVRPAEMRRLKWEDIRFNTRTLVLDALQTKTASRRTVPIGEAALMWLLPYKGREGEIWARTDAYWSKSLHRLHQQVKVRQQPNGLRHSYISYRLTLTGDVNRTALEAGNSAAMIHSHYHALVEDPELASKWFKVGLEEDGKVVRAIAG